MSSVQFKKRSKPNSAIVRPTNDSSDDDNEIKIHKPDVVSSKVVTPKPSNSFRSAGIFESSREVIPQSYAGDATYTSEIDTATDRDARAILERNIKLNSENPEGAALYKGQQAYKSLIPKTLDQIASNKFTG